MSNFLFVLITATFTSNVCTGTGFAVPSLVAYKRSFAYTAIMSGIFTVVLLLSGACYYAVYNYILLPYSVEFMSLLVLTLFVGVFNFSAYYVLKAVNKEAFYIYEKSFTFMFLFVSVLGVLISSILDQAFNTLMLNLALFAFGFVLVSFFIYGAYFKINGAYAPSYMRGVPLLLMTLSIMGLIFGALGLLL